MLWFGEPWPSADEPAPICDPLRQTQTPTGAHCYFCDEPIAANDRGVLVPALGAVPASFSAFHLRCFMGVVVPMESPSEPF